MRKQRSPKFVFVDRYSPLAYGEYNWAMLYPDRCPSSSPSFFALVVFSLKKRLERDRRGAFLLRNRCARIDDIIINMRTPARARRRPEKWASKSAARRKATPFPIQPRSAHRIEKIVHTLDQQHWFASKLLLFETRDVAAAVCVDTVHTVRAGQGCYEQKPPFTSVVLTQHSLSSVA